MLIDLQLSAATMPWPDLRDGVLAAEDAGFDTAWTFDHLSGAVLGGDTMLECWTLTGALAARTERIGLGTLVANVANRPPGVLAAAAASAQLISGGRFRLGLGAGTSPASQWAAEQRALDMPVRSPMADRHGALVDALDLFDELWRADRHERFAGFARPEPRPPIVLGVNSVALARIAGHRCDGVNVRRSHPDAERFLAAAADARSARADCRGPWDASVWARWDEALLHPDHPDRLRWASLGVGRLILTALEPLAAARVAAAASHLR